MPRIPLWRDCCKEGIFAKSSDIPEATLKSEASGKDEEKFLVIVGWEEQSHKVKYLILNTDARRPLVQKRRELWEYEFPISAGRYLYVRQRKCHECGKVQLMPDLKTVENAFFCHHCNKVLHNSRSLNCWEMKEVELDDLGNGTHEPFDVVVRLFNEDLRKIVELVSRSPCIVVKHQIGVVTFFKDSLAKINLSSRILDKADLSFANLEGADLRKASLRSTCLEGARLAGSFLVDADLTGADLRRACLRNADITGAILEGAILEGADLDGIKGR